MIISPPFLPSSGLTSTDDSKPDPMMDEVDQLELAHGIYPVAFDRRWHCGVHLAPEMHSPVYAIADGEVVAYRLCQHAVDSGNSNASFVLLKHTTDTGDGRTLTFYSLYMHLLPLAEYQSFGHDATQMPEFLRMPSGTASMGQMTPAVSGDGKKVRRKDILGFLGRYQGLKYLHFEIFMMPGDFDAYFGHTPLGNATPPTATTSDCWGHTYYMINANQSFSLLPPGTDTHNKLNGIQFHPGQTGTNTLPLVVETYFSKGAKYTNVWNVAADGTRELLTPQPAYEAEYEFELYTRAKALYPKCPSDGYDLQRFGRIPFTIQTLAEVDCTTWMKVTYAAGKQGYVDVSNPNVKKLSDADFPFFMGWRKISEDNTPFGSDGLCDVSTLKKLLKDASDHETAQVSLEITEIQKADALSRYVKSYDQVRQQLRGFICEAPSEWDDTHNEERYTKLLDDGEFYHGNEQGYNDFLKYLKEIQFWDKTGLPAGQKLWFFHPLAFIRHFRKCGWLSASELARTMPKFPFYERVGHTYAALKTGVIYTMTEQSVRRAQQPYVVHLNRTIIKYGLSPSYRRALFLAQENWETAQWRNLASHPIMHEWGYGQYSAANPATQYYSAFYGRGAMQLTWAANYRDYGDFCGSTALPDHAGPYTDRLTQNHPRITATSLHWTVNPSDHGTQIKWSPRFDPNIVADDPYHACNSAGFYWVSKPFQIGVNISRKADQPWSYQSVQDVSRGVNGGGNGRIERQAYSAFVARVLCDSVDSGEEQIINTPVGTIKVDFTKID